MRRSWDEPADESLDEPVTLTARQLRSLKWGARFGTLALVLALVAAGLAGWTTVRAARQGSETSSSVPSAAAQPQPAESRVAEAAPGGAPSNAAPSTPSPAAPAPSPASASVPATPAVTTAAQPTTHAAHAGKAAATTHATKSVGTSKYKSATAQSPKPVTESFDPSPTTAPAITPTPSPVPVTVEPAKPAAKDSSAAH